MTIRALWKRVRRNHALEHATISLLLESGFVGSLAGNATTGGFFIYGDLATERLRQTVQDALHRLTHGETDLAISRLCGTNLVVGALMAGGASLLALGRHHRIKRMPLVLATTLISIVASRPVGAVTQRHVTTDPDMTNLSVAGITSLDVGPYTVHHIATEQL